MGGTAKRFEGARGEELVKIDTGGVSLEGVLEVPEGASGVVLFAHGSGSSRKSPRNNFVAGVLREKGLGTLLMDLLTSFEDIDYERRFDIGLLSERLKGATRWLSEYEKTRGMKVGYFGASTGAAAALRASVDSPVEIGAIVSRGGRPDLAERFLPEVKAPTLLVVGGKDEVVLGLNRKAKGQMTAETELVVVPGATHLFEEPGALEEVSALAADWFRKHLSV